MPDGLWRLEEHVGRFSAEKQNILRKGVLKMETQKSRNAVLDREAHPGPDWREEYELPDVLWMEEWIRSRLFVYLIKKLNDLFSYRRPMPVREYTLYQSTFNSDSIYYLCPRCDITMEREYQAYCDRCGQCLGWNGINRTKPRKRRT